MGMDEKQLCIEMFTTVRPKLWKYIVLTAILICMARSPFAALILGFQVGGEDLAMSILGMVAIIMAWIDYAVSKKLYRMYQNELINLTKLPERSPADPSNLSSIR
jgi:hypothetical protein